MGFPRKNDHFGVEIGGVPPCKEAPIYREYFIRYEIRIPDSYTDPLKLEGFRNAVGKESPQQF